MAEKNSKTVGLKSNGHDKQNVTVMLLASAAGTKKRPMIVFKGKGRFFFCFE